MTTRSRQAKRRALDATYAVRVHAIRQPTLHNILLARYYVARINLFPLKTPPFAQLQMIEGGSHVLQWGGNGWSFDLTVIPPTAMHPADTIFFGGRK